MEGREQSLIRKIKLQTGRKLNTLFVGEYHSAFKGFGLSFDSVREYQYGDDVRSIDWNVSARMNHLYVKEYIEERELSVVLMVDVSGSTEFGSSRSKREVILETVTLLLYLAQMNNDRISVMLFADGVEKFITPRKGRKYILKVLDEILKCEPKNKKTDLGKGIKFLQRVLKKRSIVFIISDFLDDYNNYIFALRQLNRKHDIIPVQVYDELERKMDIFALTEFVDLETGENFIADALPKKNLLPELAGIDHMLLSTAEPIDKAFLQFFKKRNRSRHINRD